MGFLMGPAAPVEWTLARDLLAAALHSREGIGDVQAWPSAAPRDPAAEDGTAAGPGILNISMPSPFGHAQFEAPAAAGASFLRRTFRVRPGRRPSLVHP